MEIKDIAMRIWYFRNRKNLSARELSLRLDKSPTYINQIECGNFKVSLPVLLQILDTLEIPCSEFFADNYKNYNQDKEIMDLLNNLSVERKNTFIDLMRNMKQ